MNTDMNKPAILPIDNDFGLCWVRQYGKGCVFWTAFGHYTNLHSDPQMLQHILAGVQSALGDLAADTAPSLPHH